MEGTEHIYYAFGQIAYTVAKADGKIQVEEEQEFMELLQKQMEECDWSYDVSGIIFKLLKSDDMDPETTFNWGIKELQKYDQFLTLEMKKDFIRILAAIAVAYDISTDEEDTYIYRFKLEIENLI